MVFSPDEARDIAQRVAELEQEVAQLQAAFWEADRLRRSELRRRLRDIPSHLEWAADRFVNVHGDSPNVDYVLRLREDARRLRASLSRSSQGGENAV